MMTCYELKLEGFDVDTNGYVCDLGKFQGEHWSTAALWIEGEFDDMQFEHGEIYNIVELTSDEKRNYEVNFDVDVIALHESEDGFVTARWMSGEEYSQIVEALDHEDDMEIFYE